MICRCLVLLSLISVLQAADLDDLTWVSKDGEVTIVDCSTLASGRLEIPSTIDGLPVTVIAGEAFSWTVLSEVVIPDSVTFLGDGAFRYASIATIFLGKGITYLSAKEIMGTSGYYLQRVNYSAVVVDPDHPTLETRGAALFNKVTKTLILFWGGVGASYTIPEDVKTIGEQAFFQCWLNEITIPEGVLRIQARAFFESRLQKVTLPDSVIEIGADAFAYTWEDTQTYLEKVSFGEGVTHIGDRAFYGCLKMDDVRLPASVIYIGENAFFAAGEDDGKGADLIFDGVAPEIGGDGTLRESWSSSCLLVWPENLESFGGEESPWNSFEIKPRDARPKIETLFLRDNSVLLTITGAPNTTYLCKSSDNLGVFEAIATEPAVLALDSRGRMEFTVDREMAGRFFVIEEAP